MGSIVLLIDPVIVLLVWFLSRLLSHPRNPWQVLDVPNARSLHARPVPRMGGIAIGIGVLCGSLFLVWQDSLRVLAIVMALGGIALISWYDDRRGLSARARLMAHALAALLVSTVALRWPGFVLPGIYVGVPSFVAAILMAVFLVWATNLYNFMDGMDGLAGGMAVWGFGTLALLAYRAGDVFYAETGLLVASAALGFTISNFPPARLFMGDVGAATLGFGGGLMMLAGSARGDFPLWTALIVFSPFWIDATVTLMRRLMRGENPATAHREHYYQRLVRLGISQRRVVLGEYVLMGVCAVSAYGSVGRPVAVQWAIITFLAAFYISLVALVVRWEKAGK